MIENVLGWVLIVMLVALPIVLFYGIRRTVKKIQTQRIERDRKEREQAEERARIAREAVRSRMEREKEMLANATHVGKTTYDFNQNQYRTTVKNKQTNDSVNYVHTKDDGGIDLLTTLAVAGILSSSHNSSASSDDESRRSSSWSSSSDNDSSSSWSSSSDSGPSSDW